MCIRTNEIPRAEQKNVIALENYYRFSIRDFRIKKGLLFVTNGNISRASLVQGLYANNDNNTAQTSLVRARRAVYLYDRKNVSKIIV